MSTPPPWIQMRTLPRSSRLAYGELGAGPRTVVLVHGLGGSHANWALAAPLFAEHARVVVLDLPGFGLSPAPPSGVTFAVLGAALREAIDALVPGPFVLVGNSMGGALSLLHAARRPERLAALVLLGPAAPLPLSSVFDSRVVWAILAGAVPGLGLALVKRRAEQRGPEGLVRDLARLVQYDPSRTPESLIEAMIDVARQRFDKPWRDSAIVEATRALALTLAHPRAYYEDARRIAVPTWLLHGKEDRLVPVAAARALAREAPAFRLSVLEETGHVPQIERPAEVAAVVREALLA